VIYPQQFETWHPELGGDDLKGSRTVHEDCGGDTRQEKPSEPMLPGTATIVRIEVVCRPDDARPAQAHEEQENEEFGQSLRIVERRPVDMYHVSAAHIR